MRTGLLALAIAGSLAGCSETVLSPAHSVASELSHLDSAALERRFERKSRPARNLSLAATLWDPALLAADSSAETGAVAEPREEKLARHERWHDAFIAEQTSFTVVMELSNRPSGESAKGDPFANPRSWEFRLDRGDEEAIAPNRIEVQAIDRYPTHGGGWHWRIALAVHFPGNLYEISREITDEKALPTVPVTLHVRPLPDSSLRHGPYGRRAGKQGFRLKWWVMPVFPADAHPIASSPAHAGQL